MEKINVYKIGKTVLYMIGGVRDFIMLTGTGGFYANMIECPIPRYSIDVV